MSTTRSSRANGGDHGAPPTDMELMLYFDGELDEARHDQVEAYVRRDPGYRAKFAGLDVVAGVLRDDALSRSVADGIAGAVLARIEAGQVDEVGGAVEIPRPPVSLVASGAAAPPRAQLSRQPANDNARGIVAFAGLAVAAAAALMIWGRTEAEPTRTAFNPPLTTEAPAMPPAAALEPAPGPEVEVEPGVEVAAVDFGARMGTVFYVPQGSAESSPTTTVVWLSDNGPGGEL